MAARTRGLTSKVRGAPLDRILKFTGDAINQEGSIDNIEAQANDISTKSEVESLSDHREVEH
jgi:hypothetical protein